MSFRLIRLDSLTLLFGKEKNYVAINDVTSTSYFVQKGKIINTSHFFGGSNTRLVYFI
jgi:hypothetical protein